MQTQPKIDFQGLEASAERREKIIHQIERLEERYGRSTSCRVVVKGPGGHHQTGGLYEINVHLSLPDNREVAIERTPHLDERFQDFDFALNDAFKRARRQLQDQVGLMRGKVKQHEEAPSAVIKKIMTADGYGFLESADGREIYFHRNSVQDADFDDLKPGMRVSFKEEEGKDGPQASRLSPIGREI
ncbi:cold shock domain-containing protein [Methylocystis sp. WRRC1]|uniref:HPF/RaiA family ribosome-associated protein n=1 Tax=Methylocystis sp. WRRC1 TaxID=1732014 RepID=UPI001D13722B|nr:HPF/RaiA family ribosome-associated protein [Methylocystis sp. WRRC1]MCC3244866.1 cold shock domain-containing protein [Methylocystis sp. WRRC1]